MNKKKDHIEKHSFKYIMKHKTMKYFIFRICINNKFYMYLIFIILSYLFIFNKNNNDFYLISLIIVVFLYLYISKLLLLLH